MVEIKTHRDHPASMADSITKRLDPSCSPEADVRSHQGSGPTRVHTGVHFKGNVLQRGPDNRGEPGIDGKMRGPANRTGEI
jgi:hypothetical protein